jgi:predicted DNA-binding transcriptional regulator AlpA
MTEQLLTSKDVQEITGIKSRYTLWKKSRNKLDNFPMPYKDGSKFTRWKMSEVQAWIDTLDLA